MKRGTFYFTLVWCVATFIFGTARQSLAIQVETVADLIMHLNNPDGPADIELKDNTYQISAPLWVRRSVTIRATNYRAARIIPVTPHIHNGFTIGTFFENHPNATVTIKDLQIENFDSGVRVFPTSSDNNNGKTLNLTVRECYFSNSYHFVEGEKLLINNPPTNFRVTNLLVTLCNCNTILKRVSNPDKQGAIWFLTRFDLADVTYNTFHDINYVAIKLGDNLSPSEQMAGLVSTWKTANVLTNTIVGVWNNNTGATECHGIFTFGLGPHLIENNTINDVATVHAPPETGCEGIYSKAQSLTIRGNTLINAGGRQAMINVKTGYDGQYPGVTASSLVENNYAYRTKFSNMTHYPHGFTAQYAPQMTGIHIEGNHSTVQGNILDDPNNPRGPYGGLRISAGITSLPNQGIAKDININNNRIWIPVSIRSSADFRFGIAATMYGNNMRLDYNTIEGVSATGGTVAAIRVDPRVANITGWTIFGNNIGQLSAATNRYGVWVCGTGSLQNFNPTTVQNSNTFDSSVTQAVYVTTLGCPQ